MGHHNPNGRASVIEVVRSRTLSWLRRYDVEKKQEDGTTIGEKKIAPGFRINDPLFANLPRLSFSPVFFLVTVFGEKESRGKEIGGMFSGCTRSQGYFFC